MPDTLLPDTSLPETVLPDTPLPETPLRTIPSAEARAFAIGERDFLLDGEPFRILSGALHYFRVHPDLWADRIHKARLMGLNTIETYVAWNAHSPERGRFDTDGGLDLVRFLELVHAEGMYAIVRPGPYICAEWDNGGLPGWLFDDASVGIRRNEPRYMRDVAEYLGQVLPLVAPLQIENGGPVILVQIENEYGAYGDDASYLEELVRINREHGITVPFTTIDQPTDEMLRNGSLPSLHKTGSFGSRSLERLATLREHQPTGPLMCAEYWNGWFDHWGAHHHTAPVEQSAGDLDELLASGASVNLYMFHGGTNFGLTSGANDKGVYQPTVTSYDYDAPLAEDGTPTAKYFAFREVLGRYTELSDEVPAARSDSPTPVVTLSSAVDVVAAASSRGDWTEHDHLPTMDENGQYSGVAVYRAVIPASSAPGSSGARVLAIGEVRDRVVVRLDGATVGTLSRDRHDRTITLPGGASGVLDLVVEDQGRVNYGPRLGEHKGLIGPVLLDGVELGEWEYLTVDLDDVAAYADLASPLGTGGTAAGPCFVFGSFELGVDAGAGRDLHLSTASLGKGVVWVNGFSLGRYWSAGPQTTLIVPGPVVCAGTNDVVVLEFGALPASTLAFVPTPDLGHEDF